MRGGRGAARFQGLHGLPQRLRAIVGAGLVALLCGCMASGPQLREFQVSGPAQEVARVPYVAADGHRGSPAALAMALGAAGLPTAPASLDDEIQRGEDQDDTRTAMVRAVLARGLVPSVIQTPTVDLDTVRELRAGHTVVVLLYRGLLMRYWEYAVVVGVDPGANTFTLHTGTQRHFLLDYPDLLSAWRDSDYWAMVVTAPDDVPATAAAPQWLARAGELAASGKPAPAMQAYLAATRRWPAEPLAWAELGRLRAAQHDLRGATDAFVAALKLAPGAAAIHADFARVLRDRQCADQAQDEIGLAVAQERDPGRRAAYERLQRELDALAGPSVVCQLD